MKIVGIIPARYNSTRFPGKALVPIGGIPMVCRVASASMDCALLSEVYVATDSAEIKEACERHGISILMTRSEHLTPTSRVYEAAGQVAGDLYVFIGGDEPLVTEKDIEHVINTAMTFYKVAESGTEIPFVVNAMTGIRDRAEEADPSNIKVFCDAAGRCLSISRVPFPPAASKQGSAKQNQKKFVSIGVYTREALAFFAATPPGRAELETQCDLLRFMENKKTVLFTDIGTATLSVDTPMDLQQVKKRLKENI